jgi:hypothetical protein
VRIQLKQSIERHQLESGAHEQVVLRDASEDLVHHPLRTRVAITDRFLKEISITVDETVIDPPTRYANALNTLAQLSRPFSSVIKTSSYLIENFCEVPPQVPVLLARRIVKPPDFFEQQLVRWETTKKNAPTAGSEIDRYEKSIIHQTIPTVASIFVGRSSAFAAL